MNGRLAPGWCALLVVALLIFCIGCSPDHEDSVSKPAPADVDLSILAGSELRELEPRIVAAARTAGVTVAFSYAGTLDIVERINGGEKFDAILPPNGAYPALALDEKPVAREKLFYSRVALGVKQAKARELGWLDQAPSWADIARAARSGAFHYAMTNPTSSNTGMSALFAVAAAAAHKTEDLSVDEIDTRVLTDFLAGQTITAGSSGWLADTFAKDPSAVDGIVNYEAVLLRLNEKLAPADQLSLIYPVDGVITADYPLMLLDASKRAIWQRVVDAVKALDFQRDALQEVYLRPSNPDAPLAQALPTQTVAELAFPNRLEVIDQILLAYQGEWRRPATSIFVLDVSGSMQGARLAQMRDALKVLSGAETTSLSARYSRFQNRERVALISFSSSVSEPLLVSFENATRDVAEQTVRAHADAMVADGGTAIYSALARAEDLAKVERGTDPQRQVSIVLLTDGENNAGISAGQFSHQYADAKVRIFPILFGEADASALRELADLTGGRAFDARKLALSRVFKEIRGYQ